MRDLTVLVLGCGDIGSAVAHRLFGHGVKVALCDFPRSAHGRRGMAFTDALFDGWARLEGVMARHVPDVSGVHSAWRDGRVVPVVTLREKEVVEACAWVAVVDATMHKHQVAPDRRAMASAVVGLGPGFTPGSNCHVAVETRWGDDMGMVLRDRSTAPVSGGPRTLAGFGVERFVPAPVTGLWRTTAKIGQRVRGAELVGTIGRTPVLSPFAGSLRGLTHDEVEVSAGQRLVEVDPRDPPRVFGLGARPRAIALGVSRALGLE